MDISRLKNSKILGLTKDFLLIFAICGKSDDFLGNFEKKFWSNSVKTVENSKNSLNSAKIWLIFSKVDKIG